uniref:Glutaminase n=1 Tax=Panagrolaimus sp. ES5 TaxID=591445 RepID=A0AC34FTI4_9BILA
MFSYASSLKLSPSTTNIFRRQFILTNHHVLRPPMSSTSNIICMPFDEIDNERNKQHLFDLYRNPETNKISVSKFLKELKNNGLQEDDPRISSIVRSLRNEGIKSAFERDDIELDREKFVSTLDDKTHVIKKALKNQMIIPNWQEFISEIHGLFEETKIYENGNLATYIPQLARSDPNAWGLSICTVDGQQASFGTHSSPFCLQSVSKPFTYSMVINEFGEDIVHKYVGQEPSGRFFNEICLDLEHKPHNPMINAGAILVTSLLKADEILSDRFDFCLKTMRRFAGDSFVSFKNSVFLSERETADRNFAIAYYMREHKVCFPEKTNLVDTLDLYFQLCSISVTTDSLAVMAATLANGGRNPLTHERIVSNQSVRDTLSLMLSCGMYDYSGKFAFKIGLPAKSGVSGDMIIVVPNCMGIALYSPCLDQYGNSVRGVKFAEKLVNKFNFHHYDSMISTECDKIDPRKNRKQLKQINLSTLMLKD